MQDSFDVIIAGAGISGLLLANELSKHFSVLILEKGAESPPSKYWLTTADCLNGNGFLHQSIDSNYDHMKFISHDLTSYTLQGEYILWDSEKLTDFLKQKITANNGFILYDHRFYSCYNESDKINVLANDMKYSSKLLVDCMGYSSPLIFSKNAMQIVGYHLMYGSVLQIKEPVSPICIANTCISNSPVYLEVFPKSNGKAYVSLIKPISQINSIESLKQEFKFITEKSLYSRHFEQEDNKNKELGGIVPVGILKATAFDRIFFFGEAAQMNPSATGACLTRLLKNYIQVANSLKDKIEKNQLKKIDLSQVHVKPNRFSRNFQLFLFKEMLHWRSDDFAKFITLLEHLDQKTVNKFLFDEISMGAFFRPKQLFSVLKSKNSLWVKPFIKAILN